MLTTDVQTAITPSARASLTELVISNKKQALAPPVKNIIEHYRNCLQLL